MPKDKPAKGGVIMPVLTLEEAHVTISALMLYDIHCHGDKKDLVIKLRERLRRQYENEVETWTGKRITE